MVGTPSSERRMLGAVPRLGEAVTRFGLTQELREEELLLPRSHSLGVLVKL